MGDVGTFHNIEHHGGIQVEVDGNFRTHIVKIPLERKSSPSPRVMAVPWASNALHSLITDLITYVCLTIGL